MSFFDEVEQHQIGPDFVEPIHYRCEVEDIKAWVIEKIKELRNDEIDFKFKNKDGSKGLATKEHKSIIILYLKHLFGVTEEELSKKC